MPTSDNIEIRSEEVQEILGHVPHWFIRSGLVIIFFTVCTLLLASWFIKYPDTISSRIVLTTQNPPSEVIARSNGRVILFVKENQIIEKDEYLGVVENPSLTEDVLQLIEEINHFKMSLYHDLLPVTQLKFKSNLNLGEIQNVYLAFLKAIRDYELFKELHFADKQVKSLNNRIRFYKQLKGQLTRQQTITGQELELSRKKLTADSLLYLQKVISSLDFDKSKNEFLQFKRSFEASKTGITNTDIQIAELENKITELEIGNLENESKLKNSVEDAFKELESSLQSWQQQYLLKSPLKGKVTFSKVWTNYQFVKSGEEVMTVVPESNEYVGLLTASVSGSGKVKESQTVRIKFDNYPYQEYGVVTGRIENISLVPRENKYTIRVSLPSGLITSYKKKLEFKQEMQGQAEIVTKEYRLLERLFNQVKAVKDRTEGN